jgi:hypothetical protein
VEKLKKLAPGRRSRNLLALRPSVRKNSERESLQLFCLPQLQ